MEGTRRAVEPPRSRNGPGPGFVHRVLVAVGIVLAVVALVLVFWFGIRVWLVLFAGILLSILLGTLSTWVSARTGLGHRWSLALVVVALLALGGFFGWLLAPSMTQQFQELTRRLPDALNRAWQQGEQWGLPQWLPATMPTGAEMATAAGNVASTMAGFFRITLEVLVSILVIGFLGLYLAANPKTYVNGLVRLFPIPKRERIESVISEMGCIIRYWLLGQFAAMVAVGTLIGLGLYFVGIPLPLALGVIAGVLEFVPVFGPILAAIPAALLGFTQSPMHAVYAVGVFVLANQIEGHLIYPMAQRYAVSLPPALTVFTLALGGTLFGFMGLLLATPITAVSVVLVKRLYLEDVLGDEVDPGRCGGD
jgi:predicted PurR-regulated permease PerM